MMPSVPTQDRHRVLAAPANPVFSRRYSAGPTPTASVDELLGCGPTPVARTQATVDESAPTPQDLISFEESATCETSPLDAWAEAYGIGPACAAAPPTPATPTSQPTPASQTLLLQPTPASQTAPLQQTPIPQAAPLPHSIFSASGPCPYPMIGGGFDCTREGSRIILPPIRWPLLPPLQTQRPLPTPQLQPAEQQPCTTQPARVALPLLALPTSPRPGATPATGPTRPPDPIKPEPAWRHPNPNYNVPPFRWRPGESLRHTREFPVLDSPDPRRQAWHYCHVMSRQGVFAGHFEVHALSRADIAGNGRQHRIIVYTQGAHVPAGTYQLAMDTHPEGPQGQPRIFLLHDADANHYRTLTGCDTTRLKELLTSRQAHPVESGGAGDCLFFSVARALGFGGHHQQAARRLRHMATSFLCHHPEESVNGDTLALFVSRLDRN